MLLHKFSSCNFFAVHYMAQVENIVNTENNWHGAYCYGEQYKNDLKMHTPLSANISTQVIYGQISHKH